MPTVENFQKALHPIQLIYIGVRELSIKTTGPPVPSAKLDGVVFSLPVRISEFLESDSTIQITIGCVMSKEENEYARMEFDVQVIGVFRIDKERFPMPELNHWANHNAPLVLYPYLREQVSDLTQRCGYSPLILPLLEVPAFKIIAPAEQLELVAAPQ
jgi:preprotein translocase subunit SecB